MHTKRCMVANSHSKQNVVAHARTPHRFSCRTTFNLMLAYSTAPRIGPAFRAASCRKLQPVWCNDAAAAVGMRKHAFREMRAFVNRSPPRTGLEIQPWQDTETNKQALQRLLDRFPVNKPTVGEAQWFLRDRNFDVEEAYSKLQTCLTWRRRYGMQGVTYEDIAKESATGKAFLHSKTDIYGRPVLIVRVARHIVGQFPSRKSQELCVYYIERAIGARPEGVDTVIGIFDLRGFGFQNADFTFVRFLIDAFFNFYPRRAAEVLMVDAPLAFMGPYEVIKPALGKYGNLIKFVSRNRVRQYFTNDTLPSDFK